MPEAIVITPVKDSLETTKMTIQAITKASGNFEYIIFNDFSEEETTAFLEKATTEYGINLVNLSEVTSNPSPNYKLVLQLAQQKSVEKNCPLIIIESDVIINDNTISSLIALHKIYPDSGLIGAITIDRDGKYNFPYLFEKKKSNETKVTNHSLSFCCTLISVDFLKQFDFKELSKNKDWFDVYISRKSRKLGFRNYIAKGLEVLHLPHSSRPWKQLKYTNPVLYYFRKYFYRKDRI